MYNVLTDEQAAFMARLNVHPRGLPGINERFDQDSFVSAVCDPLRTVFSDEKDEKLNQRIKTYSRYPTDEKASE